MSFSDSIIEEYLSDFRNGLDWLNKARENGQEEKEQFQERRTPLTIIVDKVVLRKRRVPEIGFKLDQSPFSQFQT